MTRQQFLLLNGCFVRRGQMPQEAYARVRMAYEILRAGGSSERAARIAALHPVSAAVWAESTGVT